MTSNSYAEVDEWEEPSSFEVMVSTLLYAKETGLELDDIIFALTEAQTAVEFESMITSLICLNECVKNPKVKQLEDKRLK